MGGRQGRVRPVLILSRSSTVVLEQIRTIDEEKRLFKLVDFTN